MQRGLESYCNHALSAAELQHCDLHLFYSQYDGSMIIYPSIVDAVTMLLMQQCRSISAAPTGYILPKALHCTCCGHAGNAAELQYDKELGRIILQIMLYLQHE